MGNSFLAGLLRKGLETDRVVSLPLANDNADGGGLGRTTVHTEVYTDDGRIDILLLNEAGKWAMVIENKIDSTERSGQLDRYYRFVEENYPGWKVLCVYLTPRGYEPSHEAYQPFSYGTVCEIINSTLEVLGSTLSPDVRMSMEHYAQIVQRHIVSNPEPAPKGSPTLDDLHTRTKQQGNGEAFTIIRDAAEKHDLLPRTYPWSVMYTPRTNRTRGLFTVGIYDKAGRGLRLWVSFEPWTEFYGLPKEKVESTFGREQLTEDVTPRLAVEFAAKLDRLFDRTETRGAG